jgi:hypothetical protein
MHADKGQGQGRFNYVIRCFICVHLVSSGFFLSSYRRASACIGCARKSLADLVRWKDLTM